MRARRRPGPITSRPSPLLASVVPRGVCPLFFLARLLPAAAPQEGVRHSPYGARGPAYRIRVPAYRVRHPAYRPRRGCLEDGDFVPLHTRYRCAGGLRHPTTHAGHRVLRGPQGFFALPQGHGKQLAAVPIGESDEPLEPVHLLELGQDLLADVARAVVHLVRRTLQRAYSCVHVPLLLPPTPIRAGPEPSHHEYDAIYRSPMRTPSHNSYPTPPPSFMPSHPRVSDNLYCRRLHRGSVAIGE